MNLSIFDKLSAVQITPDNRITDADRKFCEVHQKAYHHAKEGLRSLMEQWDSLQNQQEEFLKIDTNAKNAFGSYINIDHMKTRDFESEIEHLAYEFIERLVRYFNSTYHVEIKYRPIQEFLLPKEPDRYESTKQDKEEFHAKLQAVLLRYEDVLEQIFIQLGGRTFAERALDEIKEKCHAAAWSSCSKEAAFILRNDTLQLTSYACKCDDWYNPPRWELQSKTKDILRGIAHFELGVFGQYPVSISEVLGYDNRDNPQIFYGCKKVQQLKMFKNGRVDIKFESKEYAEQFVSDYLGRVY